MMVAKDVVDDGKQQRLLEGEQQQQQGGRGSGCYFWHSDGDYDPFHDRYNDCYSAMNCCAKKTLWGGYYNELLDCWWYDDYENCKSSICLPKSIPGSSGEGDSSQQQQAVVCTTATVFSDHTDIVSGPDSREVPIQVNRICSSTFVQTTTTNNKDYGDDEDDGDDGTTTTMEYTFCFEVKENEYKDPETHECQSVKFETRDHGRNTTCTNWARDCSACDSDGSGSPDYTKYLEIMKAGGNLINYGIVSQDASTIGDNGWLCSSNDEQPNNQTQHSEQPVEWNDPFNRLEQIPRYCPLKPGYVYGIFNRQHQYKIRTMTILGTILVAALVLYNVYRCRRRIKQQQGALQGTTVEVPPRAAFSPVPT